VISAALGPSPVVLVFPQPRTRQLVYYSKIDPARGIIRCSGKKTVGESPSHLWDIYI
jgi:hypothetical protein